MPRPKLLSIHNIVAFALLSATAPVLTRAAADESPPTYHVHFADLNLDSAAGTEFLYRRIRWGAGIVCRGFEGREISQQAAHERCEKEAIERAVTEVGHPRLTAYYSKLNHGKMPSTASNAKSPDSVVRMVAGH
jgi:UrcA family protein